MVFNNTEINSDCKLCSFFLNWVVFLVLNCKSSSYTLDRSLLFSYIMYRYCLPILWDCLLFLGYVLWSTVFLLFFLFLRNSFLYWCIFDLLYYFQVYNIVIYNFIDYTSFKVNMKYWLYFLCEREFAQSCLTLCTVPYILRAYLFCTL